MVMQLGNTLIVSLNAIAARTESDMRLEVRTSDASFSEAELEVV